MSVRAGTFDTARGAAPAVMLAAVLAAFALAGCSGDARPLEEAIEARELGLVALSIDRPEGTLSPLVVNPGERVAFELSGRNAAGADVDVSGEGRSWSVSDPTIASIDADGVLVARADGDVFVEVRIADIVADGYDVRVSDSALESIETIREVNGGADESDTLDPCIARRYAADGRFVDGSLRALSSEIVDWTASTDDVRIEEQEGFDVLFAAARPGDVQLTASAAGASFALPLAVGDTLDSIEISPDTFTVEVGDEQALSAIGVYDDGDGGERRTDITDGVDWLVTSGAGVASVSDAAGERGVLSGEGAGSATVRASCGEVSADSTFTVFERSTDADDDNLVFEVDDDDDGEFSVALGQRFVDLRVSTGDTYSFGDDVTEDTVFRLSQGDGTVAAIVRGDGTDLGSGTDVVRLQLLRTGRAEVRATYGSLEARLIVDVN